MQVSVLAGTVFQDTHLPLTVWFRAMHHQPKERRECTCLRRTLREQRDKWPLEGKKRRVLLPRLLWWGARHPPMG